MKMTTHEPEDHMASRASWFALGLLSGAAVALLASPRNGRENRQILSRRARQVADTVATEGGAFIRGQSHRMTEVVDRGRVEVQALGSRLNEAVEQGKSAYRAAKDRFQTAAVDATDSMRHAVDDTAGPRPTV